MKKKIFVYALIGICLSIAAYSTTAFFTYEDTATNVITMGNISIELQELSIPEGGSIPVPFVNPIDVIPGTEVSKIVQIKNTGSQPAWIRISTYKSIQLSECVEGDADISLISIDLNTEYWIESDGFYYYKDVLDPDETTEPLFTKVIFSTIMGNIYQQSKAYIDINAQATQYKNNGNTVFEAAGWPKTESDGV